MWEVEGIEGSAWGCSPAAEKSWVGRISEVNVGERCGRRGSVRAPARQGGSVLRQRPRHDARGAQASFYGARARGQPEAAMARPTAVAGPRWAPCGPRPGQRRAEGGWVGPSGSTQLDRIDFSFFRIYF
jgi:hypothetical protein